MALPVALQLYSIRDEMAKDMREALIKVMSMGYDGVEFAGLSDTARPRSRRSALSSVSTRSLLMCRSTIW